MNDQGFIGDGPFAGLPRGFFRCVYADPPWKFTTRSPKGLEGRPQHYKRMTVADICALPVADLCAPDCYLLIWTSGPFLANTMRVIDAWGFTYKTKAFTWAKRSRTGQKWHTGNGLTATLQNTEIVLCATRGQPKRRHKGVKELVVEPVREHSRKPDEVRHRIELFTAWPRIELFGRTCGASWWSWGDEADKFGADVAGDLAAVRAGLVDDVPLLAGLGLASKGGQAP